ncbi:cullin-associated protein [Aureococcus anophagefferens]|uniref:Cullin-associated protein n=1 Tax=Aureococcus anophagefferens TaxID=44056 RepID=A0ABR1GFM7_AURAN
MKIKTVSRSAKKEARDTADHKYVRRNLDPAAHPFAAAREHQRAVVAAKLDRMMAKPFVCALDGHRDAITCLGTPRRGQLVQVVSGGAHGRVPRGTSRAQARWNPAEPSLVASTSRDRAATLYDTREDALRRCVLARAVRALAWNPRDPTHFVVGSEDTMCYTFDVRNLKQPKMIHEDPRRRPALAAVRFTAGLAFVLTASEDFNLRVWKARASKLGPVSSRERAALDYRAALLDRRSAHARGEARFVKSRNLPKMVKKMRDRRDEEKDRARAKLQKTMDRHGRAPSRPRQRSKVVKNRRKGFTWLNFGSTKRARRRSGTSGASCWPRLRSS